MKIHSLGDTGGYVFIPENEDEEKLLNDLVDGLEVTIQLGVGDDPKNK